MKSMLTGTLVRDEGCLSRFRGLGHSGLTAEDEQGPLPQWAQQIELFLHHGKATKTPGREPSIEAGFSGLLAVSSKTDASRVRSRLFGCDRGLLSPHNSFVSDRVMGRFECQVPADLSSSMDNRATTF